MIVHPNETVDLLGIKNYKIIQASDGFKFGIDAVLLANFVKISSGDIGVDLGSGTGIIPTIIAAKSKAKKIIGVEIQPDVCEMSARSAELNNLQDRLEFKNIDIKEISTHFEKHSFDFVTSNPPYFKVDTLASPNRKKHISRHEIAITLKDIFESASYLLKPQKKFFSDTQTGKVDRTHRRSEKISA